MATNGHCNGIQDSHAQWKLGLVNEDKKYLTAETFGFKINSSAVSLRKKQVWIVEFGSSDDEVYLKSHLGRYVSTDKMGNVFCNAESKNEEGTQFALEYEPIGGKGRWGFKSKKFNNYLDGVMDNMSCSSTTPKWWKPHLATHPQVNIRNVNRKRCVNLRRVGEDGPSAKDQLECTQVIPWGEDSLITLEFLDGKYAVKTSDDRYLHTSGELVKDTSPETLYTLRIRQNVPAPGIALMDSKGKYLTAVGTGQLKSKNNSISKDELFTLLDSQPQVYLVSHKGKKVSIKQGVDVTANQDDISDKETFQMEFNKIEKKWRFRTVDNKLWTVGQQGGIQAIADVASVDTLFEFNWLDDGKITLRASNQNYITAKMNGHLYATSSTVSDKEKFAVVLLNRPLLVLKGEYGLVGYKVKAKDLLECNKSVHDTIYVEHLDSGEYHLKGSNGKYWMVGDDASISVTGSEPQKFRFEFRDHSKFAIKAPNGRYLRGEQNGTLAANGDEICGATMWEY